MCQIRFLVLAHLLDSAMFIARPFKPGKLNSKGFAIEMSLVITYRYGVVNSLMAAPYA